jgi:succinate dehydrogenase / fumarate reductase iron-sulfur subunit
VDTKRVFRPQEWRLQFDCTDACARGIDVTKAIQEVKRALMFTR